MLDVNSVEVEVGSPTLEDINLNFDPIAALNLAEVTATLLNNYLVENFCRKVVKVCVLQ